MGMTLLEFFLKKKTTRGQIQENIGIELIAN